MTLVDRTDRASTADAPGDAPGRLRRLWAAPLWAHAAALALLVIAVFPLMTPQGAYTSDEGAYALQVKALAHGGWDYEYRAAPYDPNGDNFPVVLSDRSGDQYFPYAKHPAVPLLLRGAVALVGITLGLHLLGLLAVVVTAAAAWLLAAEFDRSLSRPAFWLAAGSPVLVNGYLIWAHAPSAAIAGFCLVAAVRVARNGFRGWAPPALAAGLTTGVLLRSEGLLFAAAVVAALAWVRLRRDGFRPAVLTAAAFGTPPVAAALLEERWIRSIVGASPQGIGVRAGDEGGGYLAGRVQGAWHELFQGAYGDGRASTLALIALLAVTGLGWLALRRGGPGWVGRLIVPCAVAVVAVVARLAVAPAEPVTGLFAAWPVALLGLLVVRWRSAPEPVRILGITGALFVLAIVATQYSGGGGLEWGGRFLSPAIALIAVLAVAGFRDRIRSLPGTARARRGAIAALVAVGVATAVLALATVGWKRVGGDRLVAAVARHPAEVTVSIEPSLPRLGWRVDGRVTWMYVDQDGVVALLDRLKAAGVNRVSVLLPRGYSLEGSPYPRVEVADEPAISAVSGQLVLLGA